MMMQLNKYVFSEGFRPSGGAQAGPRLSGGAPAYGLILSRMGQYGPILEPIWAHWGPSEARIRPLT